MILDQLSPDRFATFARRCSSKFVGDIPSFTTPYGKDHKPKKSAKIDKDKHAFETGLKTLTMDLCTILYIDMIKANQGKPVEDRNPPGVVYVEPSKWPESTASGVDQFEVIRTSVHPRPVTTRSSKPLLNAINGTTKTSHESANFTGCWRQHDGSRTLIATPKKPLQLQSKQIGEGSGTMDTEDDGGESASTVDDGDETRLPSEPPAFVYPNLADDITNAAWAYLQGGGGLD